MSRGLTAGGRLLSNRGVMDLAVLAGLLFLGLSHLDPLLDLAQALDFALP